MNILLKSSILAFLTASSVVSADSLCTRVGNNAADLIIIQNWCTPEGFAPQGSLDPKERCRELAIRQCESPGTLLERIGGICPNNPETPSQSDLFNLGNKCVRTVDGLIGRTQDEYAQANGVFLAKTVKPRIRRKPPARRHFGKKYGKMSDVAVLAAKAGKYIKSPTPPPTPGNSVALVDSGLAKWLCKSGGRIKDLTVTMLGA